MTALAIALTTFAVWVYLSVGRGGFWRGRESDATMHAALARRRADGMPNGWPSVVAVIPARDEAELIGATVRSLLAQRYPGELSIVVVDDHSADGTAAVARDAARGDDAGRLTVLGAAALPAGWTGKLWALSQGIAHCDTSARPPEWLLLTDADIAYEPDAVAALVSSALENRLVLSSLMVSLRCRSFAERTLIPAFVFFFQMLYPFAWVARADRRTAAAAGGCVLVRRPVLADAGGVASIRGALIDDCALAARLKPFGPISLALGEHVHSLRPYPAFDDIRRMIVRSAYAQLRFSPVLLAFVVSAMALVFVAPVVLAIGGHGAARGVALASWATMAVLYAPTLARYRVPRPFAVALPLIAAAYLAFTIQSAWLHWQGRGGQWKGRLNGPSGGPSPDAR